MHKLILFSILAVTVFAEPPAHVGLSRSYGAPSGSYSSGNSFAGSNIVDQALINRVGQILAQNQGNGGFGYSRASSQYRTPSSSYGAPSFSKGGFGGGVQLGRIERAQRIAAFDLSSRGRSGGYSSYASPPKTNGGYY